MILVDANILLYAENEQYAQHTKARAWWDAQLSGAAPVGLCWPVLGAFIRIGTNQRIYGCPLTLTEAIDRVDSWLSQPCVRILTPTQQHWTIFRDLLQQGQAVGNLVTDAHLAAMTIEHGCELQSTDADFARFPGLKWRNPLR